jgi:hypothetical protein
MSDSAALASMPSQPSTPAGMSRWRAAGYHLLISLAVGAAALALVALVWYPPPFLIAARGHELVMILTGVDVIIGPLLTLAVFKAGKWGMKFDLAVIAILQAAALVYGLYIMAQARPIYIVFAVDRFDLVSAVEITPAAFGRATKPEYKSAPWFGPKWAGARVPAGQSSFDITMSALSGGADIHQLPQYYQDYKELRADALARAFPVADLARHNRGQEAQIAAAIADTGKKAEDVKFLPLRARKFDLTVLVDGKTGDVLKVVDLRPW